MDIQHFSRLWQNKPFEGVEPQKFWDMRADEFNNRVFQQEGNSRLEKVMSLLSEKNMLADNTQVLDIGCGPGKYSLAFADKVAKVVGIDLSPRMLELARENALVAGKDNLNFAIRDWKDIDLNELGWLKAFDLVFASMCPGINSGEALLKMCRASRKYCFLATFVQRTGTLRDEIQRNLGSTDNLNRWEKNFYYALNILLLSGYYPEIHYFDTKWENSWPLAEAVELYSCQLTTKVAVQPQSKIQLVKYLSSIAVDGIVSESGIAKIAWISWAVK